MPRITVSTSCGQKTSQVWLQIVMSIFSEHSVRTIAAVIVAANLHHGKHSKGGLKRNQTLHLSFRSFQNEIDLASNEEKHGCSDNLAGFRKANEEGARLTGTLQKKVVAEKVTWQDRFICITNGMNCGPTPVFLLAARFQPRFRDALVVNICMNHPCRGPRAR